MAKIVFLDTHIAGKNPGYKKLEAIFANTEHELVGAECKSKEEVIEQAKDADAIITTYTPVDREIIESCPNLKVILRNAIGYEIFDFEAANERGIAVCNVPDYCTEEVATHTIALLLACYRKIKVSNDLVRSGDWKVIYGYQVRRLSTQTLGIIGFGRIARLVAGYAQAFGIKVIAHDPYVSEEDFKAYGVRGVSLEEIYKESDAICVNAPLTKDNYHMINEGTIAKMKDGVILVNTGRGQLISTTALVEAVKNGKVKAAGLDVLEEEPLKDATAEILNLENVIVTCHIAMDSLDAVFDNYIKAADSVIELLDGNITYNVLNKDHAFCEAV
ncbi:C-terminal binding protein [Vibrio parahaemolyticus]|uniref:C-terminal binding protein n=1 Tax=Vibrio mediterranei TaxID=689 RepID=UPI00406937EF